MRRACVAMVVVLSLVGCGRESLGPTGELDGPIEFRALSEQQNAAFCDLSPGFSVATIESEWIDAFDRASECQPGGGEMTLPSVNFDDEVGLAVWWKVAGCLGHTIRTVSIERDGPDVIVTGKSEAPDGACATALGQLESYLAVERSDRFDGKERIRLVLDGDELELN